MGLNVALQVNGNEPETSAYMLASGANPSVETALNLWIKGLKGLGAWSTSRMWILRDAYHGAGSVVYGMGGAGAANAGITNGAGSVTRNANYFEFTGLGAKVSVSGQVYMPAAAGFSAMFVIERPSLSAYGGGMGGAYGTIGFRTANSEMILGNDTSTACLVLNPPGYAGPDASTPGTRHAFQANVTGDTAGSTNVNGVAFTAWSPGASYAGFSRDTNFSVWQVGTAGSSATSRCSFGCIWTSDQSANAAAIYALFKSTIGAGLSLP